MCIRDRSQTASITDYDPQGSILEDFQTFDPNQALQHQATSPIKLSDDQASKDQIFYRNSMQMGSSQKTLNLEDSQQMSTSGKKDERIIQSMTDLQLKQMPNLDHTQSLQVSQFNELPLLQTKSSETKDANEIAQGSQQFHLVVEGQLDHCQQPQQKKPEEQQHQQKESTQEQQQQQPPLQKPEQQQPQQQQQSEESKKEENFPPEKTKVEPESTQQTQQSQN
eukprot:TRINITY_DN7890_c0_g1_i1.p1 TRINITY_DN7890_c0_g1~~TRINITY_DN7890_c0_g1_i1.p1  ORF type:complete len:223 (-),score=38.45 TRINITY_DN7890_c0_g1_i1:173-841(-)